MSYKDLINKIKSAGNGGIVLTKQEARAIIIALKLLDCYDEALSEALGLN